MTANPFWEFSLEFYGRPGVAQACLALQDEAGLDVNLLLFCIWAARGGPGSLTPAALERAISASAAWRLQVVGPLRAARRAAKGLGGEHALAFRDDLAATELAAERVEQWLLYESLPGRNPRSPPVRDGHAMTRLARGNLLAYLEKAGADAGAAQAQLEVLLGHPD